MFYVVCGGTCNRMDANTRLLGKSPPHSLHSNSIWTHSNISFGKAIQPPHAPNRLYKVIAVKSNFKNHSNSSMLLLRQQFKSNDEGTNVNPLRYSYHFENKNFTRTVCFEALQRFSQPRLRQGASSSVWMSLTAMAFFRFCSASAAPDLNTWESDPISTELMMQMSATQNEHQQK